MYIFVQQFLNLFNKDIIGMFGFTEIFCGAVVFLIIFYYYATLNYDFWKRRNMFGPKPVPLFGNFTKIMTTKTTKAFVLQELYEAYPNEPILGIFDGRQPAVLLRNPELFNDIFTKNFVVFPERGISIHEKAEPLTLDLFCLDSERWQPVRQKLSPAFASGRLKEMFHMITECADLFDKHLEKEILKDEIVECRELFAKYTIDVIGTCAFGLDVHDLEEEHSEYHRMCADALKISVSRLIRYWLKTIVPWFYDMLGYVLPYTKVTKFFRDTVRDTLDYRKRNNIVRYDFMNELQNIKDHSQELAPIIKVTDIFLAAQAFVFFTAGFDASALTLTHAFYELAQNSKIQDKLREEIREEFAKNKGTLPYEAINRMSYLNKVFRETLRKHPAILMLLRESLGNYTFKDMNISIPKGVKVFISILGIHNDPSIYPEPHIFDPERFSEDAIASRHPNAYLPYGIGPRMCIGARFSNYVVKMGICKLLLKYKFDVCEKTDIPYTLDKSSFLKMPTGEIYLKVTKLKDVN